MNRRKNINKFLSQILLITLASLIIFSCEDVIKVDLNSIDPSIVIDAKVKDDGSLSTAIITKSTDFYNPGEYERVSDAVIIISDNSGNSQNMSEISDGNYETNMVGESGKIYSIEVNVEGEIYEAVSTIPEKLIIDSLWCEEAPERPRGEEESIRIILHIYFKDYPDISDYARIVLSINGEQLSGFYIYEDKFTDGNDIDLRLFLDSKNQDFKFGDLVGVELQSIDKASYDFYLTASSVNATSASSGGRPRSTSVAPTNPVTNWSNKALGVFAAYTVSRSSIVLESK